VAAAAHGGCGARRDLCAASSPRDAAAAAAAAVKISSGGGGGGDGGGGGSAAAAAASRVRARTSSETPDCLSASFSAAVSFRSFSMLLCRSLSSLLVGMVLAGAPERRGRRGRRRAAGRPPTAAAAARGERHRQRRDLLPPRSDLLLELFLAVHCRGGAPERKEGVGGAGRVRPGIRVGGARDGRAHPPPPRYAAGCSHGQHPAGRRQGDLAAPAPRGAAHTSGRAPWDQTRRTSGAPRRARRREHGAEPRGAGPPRMSEKAVIGRLAARGARARGSG